MDQDAGISIKVIHQQLFQILGVLVGFIKAVIPRQDQMHVNIRPVTALPGT